MTTESLPRPTSFGAIWLLIAWALIAMTWWGMAFFPITELGPNGELSAAMQVLARAQEVCFGKIPGQPLPFSGWILLFGGPAALLISLLIVYRDEIIHSLRNGLQRPVTKTLLIAFALIFVLESFWVAGRIRAEYQLASTSFDSTIPGNLPAHYPRTTLPVHHFSLIDQKGASFTDQSLKGKITVLTFVFAHCPSVCPALVQTTKNALIGTNPKEVQGVMMTLDPWRDRPSSLPDLAIEWEIPETIHLLSGSVESVNLALELFQVNRSRDEKNGDVIHPSLVYVIDKTGAIAYSFNNPSTQWLKDAIARL